MGRARGKGGRWAVAVVAAAGVLAAAGPAAAQVPPVPTLPEPPPAAGAAIDQAVDTGMPLLITGLEEAYPVVNAVGFPLRPVCAASWATVLVMSTTSGLLPIDARAALPALYLVCGAAYGQGPADAVFRQVDDAAGDRVEAAVDPALARAHDALDPVRPQLGQACATLKLVAVPPYTLPRPLHRFDSTKVLCAP